MLAVRSACTRPRIQQRVARCYSLPDGSTPAKVLVIGGCGRVGSAAAAHMLSPKGWNGPLEVTIAGRRQTSQMESILAEITEDAGGKENLCNRSMLLSCVSVDFENKKALVQAVRGKDVVIHTAGPYMGKKPDVLEVCIQQKVPVYVDVSDPLDYIDAALCKKSDAKSSGTAAVVSAGAFPGLSNVLAVELAQQLPAKVSDVRFSYFTAGLGGSGVVNLLITNLGFGEAVPVVRNGKPSPQFIGGLEPEKVDFFIDDSDASARLIGTRTVWAWPFPEVATVAKTLSISGSSDVKMGTAPDVWNVVLGGMAKIVPRSWWANETFSKLLADFSQPMVALTDKFVGETHGVRVDVIDEQGNRATAIQGHKSFRICVGQSCAEFAMHLLHQQQSGNAISGVHLPEELAGSETQRQQLLNRLVTTPGTFTYRVEVTSNV